MRRREAIMAMAAVLIASGTARAEGTRLTASEIRALLGGKRIQGDWNGTAYSQVFWESGATTYLPRGGRPDHGKWRVNADDDTYQSWWENSGWSSYAIERDGGVLYWIDSAGGRHPFEVTGDG